VARGHVLVRAMAHVEAEDIGPGLVQVRIISLVEEAGPKVATILILR
jgi:hypothetical protein